MANRRINAVPSNRGQLPRSLEQFVRYAMLKMQVHGAVEHGHSLRLGIGSRISSFHGLSIGNYVSVGRGTHIEVDGSIGDYCLIARGVQIVGRADHALDEVGVPMALSTWVGERASGVLDRVEIGDDVWIGGGALILGGVSIGAGAVIGAGSVVTKDVAPFGIAVGNPARVVRQRFDSDEQRAAHLDVLARRVRSSDTAAT